MILLHQTIEVVDEALTGVFGIFEVAPHVTRFYRADFLTHAAENATELVDLVDDGVAVTLIVFPANEPTYSRTCAGRMLSILLAA